MKRSLKDLKILERDERERQEDDLLRAQLEREEAAEGVSKKQKNKEENYSAKWKGHLEKWDEMGLQIASDRELTLPVPNPPGILLLSFNYYYYSLNLIGLFLGASLNLGPVGRKPSALKCLAAFLPDDVWRSLVDGTNQHLIIAQSKGQVSKDRKYRPCDMTFLKKVMFARLDMIARGARTIDEAYAVPEVLGVLSSLEVCADICLGCEVVPFQGQVLLF
jgi:hypothetical protein